MSWQILEEEYVAAQTATERLGDILSRYLDAREEELLASPAVATGGPRELCTPLQTAVW